MRVLLCAVLFPLLSHAGTIQGSVLEHVSGLPLARTLVLLQPVRKTGAEEPRPLMVRAGNTGHFVFPAVPNGLYLLTARRDGYFPAGYGQRRPNGQGTPILVTPDSDLFTELKMHRMGAITGRVLDENGIGMPGVKVIAYSARLPLRSTGHAESDDRGVYRIYGLNAGKYWIRTAAATLDDGSGRLPTFGWDAREVREAKVYEVKADTEAIEANVRPEPGTLFRLRGKVLCEQGPIMITISSETGRQSKSTGCNALYEFDGLAPGKYEIFATTEPTGPAGFVEIFLDRDSDNGNFQLRNPITVEFQTAHPQSAPQRIPVAVFGRRQDLAESDEIREIPTPRTVLAPGHWELTARVGPGEYVESIADYNYARRRDSSIVRPPEWFDVSIGAQAQTRVSITISDKAAAIEGSVMAGSKPVPAAPVFLWPTTEGIRRSLGGVRQVLTDVDGKFRFDGLPPGDYRILASFDISEVDEDVIEESKAMAVHVDPSQTGKVEVALWQAP